MLTNKLTTILTTAALVTAVFVMPLSVFAQTVSPTVGANKTARLAKVNTNCQNAVSQRLSSLNSVLSRIPTLKRLSSTLQQQFSSEVTTNITGLQGVQAQCTTDYNSSNITNLITDYKSVFLTYRIYAVMLPQLHLLIASDTMGYTANNLNTLYGKLQTRVQSAGNPSNLTALLSDMQAKITDAQTQYANAESQVTSLTPASYNSNPSGTKSTFQTARGEIKTGATDLQTDWSDAKQIIQALKVMGGTTPSPTPTP